MKKGDWVLKRERHYLKNKDSTTALPVRSPFGKTRVRAQKGLKTSGRVFCLSLTAESSRPSSRGPPETASCRDLAHRQWKSQWPSLAFPTDLLRCSPLGPVHVTLFGNRVLADVISYNEVIPGFLLVGRETQRRAHAENIELPVCRPRNTRAASDARS